MITQDRSTRAQAWQRALTIVVITATIWGVPTLAAGGSEVRATGADIVQSADCGAETARGCESSLANADHGGGDASFEGDKERFRRAWDRSQKRIARLIRRHGERLKRRDSRRASSQPDRADVGLAPASTVDPDAPASTFPPDATPTPTPDPTPTATPDPTPTATAVPTPEPDPTPTTEPSPTPTPTPSPAPTSPPAPPPAASAYFATLPPGSALPSEAECASRVRPAPEIRAINIEANATRGTNPNDEFPRVTGNFVGTTDEIIQWAACKWGVDEDLVRAQMSVESWWRQNTRGDFTTDQSRCHPDVQTTSGPCGESVGIGQVKFFFHGSAYEDSNAINSTAYNIDYTYQRWRLCFDGELTWLNNNERGREYAAGDAWGCAGVWFAGRWYTPLATDYMARVRTNLDDRLWETELFING